MTCFLAQFSDKPCSGGKPIRCHLIRQNTLKRLLGKRDGERAARDSRSYVMACGGSFGIGGHHHELDHGRLVIPRSGLPESFLAFLDQYGLSWYADRHYPEHATSGGLGS